MKNWRNFFFVFKSSHKTIICLQLWCLYWAEKLFFFTLVFPLFFCFLSHARLACMREIFASFTWKMIFLSFLLSRDGDYIIFALSVSCSFILVCTNCIAWALIMKLFHNHCKQFFLLLLNVWDCKNFNSHRDTNASARQKLVLIRFYVASECSSSSE